MDAVGRTVGTRVCFLRGMRSLHAGPALAFSQMIDERVAMYYVHPAIFVVIYDANCMFAAMQIMASWTHEGVEGGRKVRN